MGAHYSHRELDLLRGLRAILIGMEGRADGAEAPRYWSSAEALRLYDEVFAERIRWKWEAVLDEVQERAPAPLAPRRIIDWAAGTGVATRAVLARIPAPESVLLVDRDDRALAFARERILAEHPGIEVEVRNHIGTARCDLLLVSHVLDELEPHAATALEGLALDAGTVLWVEPGSSATSRRLGAARDRLIAEFDVIAPCTHRAACGMFTEDHAGDWCHFFAKPPAEVHTTSRWTQIGRELGIDLRSLPYSFLALTRASVEHPAWRRVIGRPRLQRGRMLVDVCGAEGVVTEQLLQREHKELYRALKKDPTVLRELGPSGE